jgi:hypothetical protein
MELWNKKLKKRKLKRRKPTNEGNRQHPSEKSRKPS